MKATFLIHCPDQPGIISTVTSFIQANGGNIIYLDQHVDKEAGVFFMRLESEFEDTEDAEVALKDGFDQPHCTGLSHAMERPFWDGQTQNGPFCQ